MGRWWIMPFMLIAAGGCEIAFPIESAGTDARVDATGGSGPRVFSSPSPAASIYGGYPTGLTVTLATDQPSATIYYTTDGSTPSMASTNAPNPATVAVKATQTLRYFGVGSGGSSATTAEMYSIDATASSKAGYIVTGTTLDGSSPVVIVSPGQALAGRADVQVWVQSTCAACGAQVVVGIDDVDQGCLYDGSPGVYPGATSSALFNLIAPTTPGVHEVRIAHIEETSCAVAMSTMALATRPTLARIGVIVVQ